jgi:hypothetical protein
LVVIEVERINKNRKNSGCSWRKFFIAFLADSLNPTAGGFQFSIPQLKKFIVVITSLSTCHKSLLQIQKSFIRYRSKSEQNKRRCRAV